MSDLNEKILIEKPNVKVKYDIIDSHLHYTDSLQKTDGFPALVEAMDAAGVSKAVVFGMGMAKQWDASRDTAPSYYLSDDCRCYYYSGTDFIVGRTFFHSLKKYRRGFFHFVVESMGMIGFLLNIFVGCFGCILISGAVSES